MSVLALFCELLVIRWVSTEIRIFAYFKNLPLMAVFLGLGLGFIWSERKRDLYEWSAFALMILAGLLTTAFGLGLTYLTFVNPDQFMMWGLQGSLKPENVVTIQQTLRSLAIMLAVFSLIASIFIGLGQRTGKCFSQLPPLKAYSINVFGGLLGTILFSALSFMSTGPMVWLIVAGLLYFAIERRAMPIALCLLGIAYGVYLEPLMTKRAYGGDCVKTVWSPYYRIDVVKQRGGNEGRFKDVIIGYNLFINYDSFQSIVDCSPETLAKLPPNVAKSQQDLLTEPMRWFKDKRPDQEILVLGSGSGSDVAAAIRNGIKHIDAIEIDPAIAQIGKEMHPEKPYDNPDVKLYITDARNFLQTCNKKYDVIVFAALDSHAAFSSLSSLRMDNYVFTEESLKSAANCLKPGGIICVSFVMPGEWLWDRHLKTLAKATGAAPVGYRAYADMNSGMLFGANGGIAPESVPDYLKGHAVPVTSSSPISISTDDWPFLFLPKREIPTSYILPIVAVLLLSAIPVALEFARGARNVLNWQMFFLGMAFMMMEVRAMADISLLFGSTWVINSVIISAVMIVILIGNYIAMKISERWVSWLLAGVIVSLLASTMVSSSSFIPLGPTLGGTAACTMYLFPLIFASTCFALLFKGARNPSTALAFNLIGGVGGVCLEYASMMVGIRALGFIGAALYSTVLGLNFLRKPLPVTPESAAEDSANAASEAPPDTPPGSAADQT